jgi:hypothetical protein
VSLPLSLCLALSLSLCVPWERASKVLS